MDQELVGDASKRRLFAMGIDNVVGCLAGFSVASVLPEALSAELRTLVAVGVYLLVFFVQEGAFATTLGKRLCGLAIYRLDGSRAGWDDSAIRTAFRLLEVNPVFGVFIGGLAIAFSKRNQRFGDRVAGTVVMRRWMPVPERAIETSEAEAARAE